MLLFTCSPPGHTCVQKAMVQFEWHDGTVKNIHVDLPFLYEYQVSAGSHQSESGVWGGGGKREGIVREFGMDTYGHVPTALFEMDNQQEPTVQHKELCSMFCGCLDGREV